MALFFLCSLIPIACQTYIPTPVYPVKNQHGVSPTATATNLNGWTSTPTATFVPTPAYISGWGAGNPNNLAYGNGNIYVAEGGNTVNQVQVFNASTGASVTQWTGYGLGVFQYPIGVAVNQ